MKNPISATHDRWQLSHCESAPNGALMRTSVVGLWPKNVEKNAIVACRVTHYDPRCVGICVIATEIIYNLVWKNLSLSYSDILNIAHQYDNRIAKALNAKYQRRRDSDYGQDCVYLYSIGNLWMAIYCSFGAHGGTIEGILGDFENVSNYANNCM